MKKINTEIIFSFLFDQKRYIFTNLRPITRFFRHRTPKYSNFFHSINLPVDKVYNAKNNFCHAIPYRKIGRKKGSKKVIFWKKFFLGKTQKRMVFIFDKVKLGVGLYFSDALLIWDTWDMAEKNTQSLWPKFLLNVLWKNAEVSLFSHRLVAISQLLANGNWN